MENITTATTTVLTPQTLGENGKYNLRITNNHTDTQTISLFLNDGTSDFYIIKELVMPVATAVEIPVSFEPLEYSCKLQTHSATTNITIRKMTLKE